MTTPTEARKLAEYRGHEHPATHIRDALRDLADQVEALTAQLDSYKAELTRIANANPKNWDAPHNDTATFQIWAQSRARYAIAKGTS